jgi:hypothetical protein
MGPGVVAVACSAHDQVRDGHSNDQQWQLTVMTDQQQPTTTTTDNADQQQL